MGLERVLYDYQHEHILVSLNGILQLFGKLTGDDRNVNHALEPSRGKTKIAEVSGIVRSDLWMTTIVLRTRGWMNS